MYVGGLDEKVSEPLLWELFLQAGPVVNTHMPKDRVTGQHQGEGPPNPNEGQSWGWDRGMEARDHPLSLGRCRGPRV